ncbi:MAG: UDP-N-acetylmuramoyl-tripeptide--D-alanyl-D-alanine ligase [Bacteroidetes bacterium]|nr:MAG: UDP-N-acetylmuramoyl-tripeptide--D-alanyl-D-alanine ligase [Bacteroidota bacterium]
MSVINELYRHFKQAIGITTDSRNVETGSIFFALKGEHFDGNKYASEALEKGASIAVVDDKEYATGPGCFLVEDALKTLQELATFHRKKLDIHVIGLTGTNGKTTSKELIRQVLSTKYKTYATSGNLNNHIGVPLTILSIENDIEIAVVEMGANHVGEIAQLCQIAQPTLGLITNIGKAHLEGFGSYEGVIRAKSELYDYLLSSEGKAYVHYNDELLMKLASRLTKETYGSDNKADVHASIIASLLFLEVKWNTQIIKTQLYGDYNFENVMAAVCTGISFGIDPLDISAAIASYIPVNNRSQLVKSSSNTIIMDAYNANPSSMLAAIRHFRTGDAERKTLILGDMLELGTTSPQEHQSILDEIRNKFEMVILVGPEFLALGDKDFLAFENTLQAAEWIRSHPIRNACILLKGSRGIALEKLTDYL